MISLEVMQKILFADLFQLVEGLKAETKVLQKEVAKVTDPMDWDNKSILVNGIAGEAMLIAKIAKSAASMCDAFAVNGPYPEERIGTTPLEGMAKK